MSIPITGFLSYQDWLIKIFEEAKKISDNYSYAKFSEDLGLGSSNAHQILSGKRKLTPKTGQHVIKSLRLFGKAKKYLETLISIENAKDTAEREKALSELLKLKTKSISSVLEKMQLQFFAEWYNAAILEVLQLPNASDDPKWIANILNPKVSVPNIKKSLKLLLKLGYIAEKSGRLRPTHILVSTGDEAHGIAINSFHQQMIELGKLAIDSCPPEEREISSLTFALNKELKQQLKNEIVSFRKRVIGLAKEVKNPNEIVQLNFQLFSLLQTDEEEQNESL